MEYRMVNVTQIKPHPVNSLVYGDSYDQELYNSIEKEGILTPLRITKRNLIISGHRRHAVAIELGITDVPVVYSEQTDDLLIQREVIESNRQREKTKEQRAREYKVLKEIESELAKRRKLSTLKQNADSPNLDTREEDFGRSDHKAAEQVGMKRSTAETASKVVDVIDELKLNGQNEEAEYLSEKLNKSVSGAAKESKVIQSTMHKNKPKPTFNQTTDSIEWAKWTWNPVTGCLHGCSYCYARDITKRYPDAFPHGFKPHFYPERLDAPKNTKPPANGGQGYRSVFVCSMADLFGEWVEQKWIDEIVQSCANAPEWIFIFLTKNPSRLVNIKWPENAWVGTTVDCQDRVVPAVTAFAELNVSDYRPPVLFLSCEPLLEQLDFGEKGMDPFDWVIIGGCSASSGNPASQPDFKWAWKLTNEAINNGIEVYWKPNLKCRPMGYPKIK